VDCRLSASVTVLWIPGYAPVENTDPAQVARGTLLCAHWYAGPGTGAHADRKK
jgi:hypothetical protein